MFKNNLSSHTAIQIPNINELKQKFSGNILLPGNQVFTRLSETFTHKGSPALILQPASATDVSTAVKYANENSFLISIRSGGHGLPGFATNNGGLIIDLSSLNKVEVIDKSRNIVRVGAGALWGDVAKVLQEHKLAISSGDTKSVGVGGLILGGGIGWMVRKVGLTIDNLEAAEIVTADGQIRKVDSKENSDLFWAIKGGGGNFGVVTYFDLFAQKLDKVVTGTVQYGIENIQQILRMWRDYFKIADVNLNSTIKIMPSMFGNPPAIFIQFCYGGNDGNEARKAIEPLLSFDQVIHQDVQEIKYPDLLEEPMHPPDTLKIAVKNILAKTLNDELIYAIAELKEQAIQVRSIKGKFNTIASDDSAFPYRDCEVLVSAAYFTPVSLSESERGNALKSWDYVKSFSAGIYVNFLSEPENVKELYPQATYNRLLEIKKKYDPENTFRQNYNIT